MLLFVEPDISGIRQGMDFPGLGVQLDSPTLLGPVGRDLPG
jgi:hypothetical protein